jgi:Spy/CpxP family protein refolding chaperone
MPVIFAVKLFQAPGVFRVVGGRQTAKEILTGVNVMNRHKKALWAAGIAILLIATMVAGASAQSQQQIRKRQALRNAAVSRAMLAGLNLSQEQKDQIKAILAGHKEEIKGVAKENAAARRELAAAMAGGADSPSLKAAYDKVAGAGWDRVQLQSKVLTEIKGVLTPEQLQQLEKRKQMRANLVRKGIKKQ